MKELIESLNKEKIEKNWHTALFIVLSLPDICGKIQFPSDRVGSRYKRWFNSNLKKYYIHNVGAKKENVEFLCADECYSLRCALLHEGSGEIKNYGTNDILQKFVFSTTLPHLLLINNTFKTIILNVEKFCEDVYYSALSWYNNNKIDKSILNIHSGKSFTI